MDSPWICFKVDLSAMGADFWMQLGEARSKCEHLTRVPTPPEVANELHRVALTKGAHATTAIEGNTLTEEDVARIVRNTATSGDDDYQAREVANVLTAFNGIRRRLEAGERPSLTPELICEFNRQVLDGLELPEEVRPGKIRTHPVTVGPYRGPDWERCESLLQEMCTWLNGPSFDAQGTKRIPVAILKASLAHLYLAWIHPFGDGNGRTARLCEFLVLVTSGVPTSAAHLISNYCNLTRNEYYRQLQYASKSGRDVTNFLKYCADGFVSGLADQLNWLYDHQLRLTWREYVQEQVTGRDQPMRERRALIAEALLFRGPVEKGDIPQLTPRLAGIYATNGPKTLTRDINELVKSGLLHEDGTTYSADQSILLSLLPLVVAED